MLATISHVYGWLAARPILVTTCISVLAIFVFSLYRRCWPQPLPNIPYDKAIGWFGDLPGLTAHVKEHGTVFSWLVKQNVKHQSILTQVFITPLSGKPTLVLTDAREAQDILLRRHNEFDRSKYVGDFVRGLLPSGQITFETGDEWRSHRGLVKDLMTVPFLHGVSAPTIYECGLDLTRLWQKKVELGGGAPFAANMDIYFCAMDAIFDAAFGSENGMEAIRKRLHHIEQLKEEAVQSQSDGSVKFSEPPLPEIAQAVLDLVESTEIAVQSTAPRYAWKVLAWVPWWARAWKVKEDLIRTLVEKAKDRMESSATEGQQMSCALDNMVARELKMAGKSGRQPQFHSRAFYDEVFGYIVGGHDTTSSATQWAVKLLAENSAAQTTFRNTLFSSLRTAKLENRQPTVEELINIEAPYIYAILEELMRHALPLPGAQRVATRDTVVLGHHVPKGTAIWMLSSGPDFFSPGFPVEDEVRSRTSREAFDDGKSYGAWDAGDMAAFKPERWLVKQGEQVAFNKMAGLHLSFGLGMRACFGRRLAELEFKIFMCLFVWNFVFEPIEGELSSNKYSDKLTRVPHTCYVRLTKVS